MTTVLKYINPQAMIRSERTKPRRGPAVDADYREWIRTFGCVVCWGRLTQPIGSETRNIECAHVGERGLGQKCSDYETIPLCARHHRIGSDSHHALGKKFWAAHKLDRDALISQLNAMYEKPKEAA